MKKILVISALAGAVLSIATAFAFMPIETARYFNGPTVSSVTTTSANVSLADALLAGMSQEEKSGVYFEYYETNKVCIAIYPTPAECLPKKTTPGVASVLLTGLKPNTSYTVLYKRDNTIRCITTPCPTNDFSSLSVTFITKSDVVTGGGSPGDVQIEITKNLGIGSSGAQVVKLQSMLIDAGYMKGRATGYFGVATFQAVIRFQKSNAIHPTGFVGILTRKALNGIYVSPSTTVSEERFEGTVTAYSNACFADGICSITVDGKTIVTTIGRAQGPLGSVLGVPDFGSVESKVGAHAKVYAKKTTEGYTLYGNSGYYVEIQ